MSVAGSFLRGGPGTKKIEICVLGVKTNLVPIVVLRTSRWQGTLRPGRRTWVPGLARAGLSSLCPSPLQQPRAGAAGEREAKRAQKVLEALRTAAPERPVCGGQTSRGSSAQGRWKVRQRQRYAGEPGGMRIQQRQGRRGRDAENPDPRWVETCRRS